MTKKQTNPSRYNTCKKGALVEVETIFAWRHAPIPVKKNRVNSNAEGTMKTMGMSGERVCDAHAWRVSE